MDLYVINGFPTSEIFKNQLGLERFREYGLNVHFFDMSKVFWSSEKLAAYHQNYQPFQIKIFEEKKINSKSEFINEISKIPRNSIVLYLSRFYRLIDDDWVFEVFKKYNIRYILQHFDTTVRNGINFEGIKDVYRWIKHKANARNIRPLAVIGSGRQGRVQVKNMYGNAHFISIPSLKIDYTAAINEDFNGKVIFVDEAIESAPDAKLLGCPPSNDLRGYYERLNSSFDVIEKYFQLQVIIAASIKYKYPRNVFGGREIIYGNTHKLIKGAKIVVGHMSLALDQAIASRKPILLLNDESFTDYRKKGYKLSLSTKLIKPCMASQLDETAIITAYSSFSSKKWANVEDDYLNEGFDNRDYQEILSEYIKKIY